MPIDGIAGLASKTGNSACPAAASKGLTDFLLILRFIVLIKKSLAPFSIVIMSQFLLPTLISRRKAIGPSCWSNWGLLHDYLIRSVSDELDARL